MAENKCHWNNTAWISILSVLHREHQKEYTNLRTTACDERAAYFKMRSE